MRVHPAHADREGIAIELDVRVEDEVVVGAAAMEHEVVRRAEADVRVAVQVVHLHVAAGKAHATEVDDRTCARAVLAVVHERHVHGTDYLGLAGRRNRDRKAMERAVEERTVRLERHDADLERRGKQGWGAAAVRPGRALESIEFTKTRGLASDGR